MSKSWARATLLGSLALATPGCAQAHVAIPIAGAFANNRAAVVEVRGDRSSLNCAIYEARLMGFAFPDQDGNARTGDRNVGGPGNGFYVIERLTIETHDGMLTLTVGAIRRSSNVVTAPEIDAEPNQFYLAAPSEDTVGEVERIATVCRSDLT